MRNILGLTAGFGLLTNTGDVHRQMRKALNPAFSVANLTARELSSQPYLLNTCTDIAGRNGYVLRTYQQSRQDLEG